jgi:hypothetical protein
MYFSLGAIHLLDRKAEFLALHEVYVRTHSI